MKPGKEGYRVAVVGASSLLGKELLTVLEEGKLPISRLVTFDTEEDEPELPIIDLREGSATAVQEAEVAASQLDFAFLTARVRPWPAFLHSSPETQGEAGCLVIDLLGEGLDLAASSSAGEPSGSSTPVVHPLSVPFLDRRFSAGRPAIAIAPIHVSPHAAVIVLSSLLLRMGARFPIERAVAQVFCSASESGSRGIEELQKQTVSLLSFQKIPRQVFGAQLAFNLLSRPAHAGSGGVAELEARLCRQLQNYLGNRVPPPALRLFQAPVFYSLAVSLYVETAEPVAPEAAAAAVAGEHVRVRKPHQDAPTQVEVTGSSDILVDSISSDSAHPNGLWLWAVADNLRLAATNAVDLAASLRARA